MKRLRPFPIMLLVTLLFSTRLIAHDTWFVPDRFRTARPGPVTLSISSGMAFPALDHAIAADRVEIARWRSGRGEGKLPSGRVGTHALELTGHAARGVTAFWVVLHPRPSTLKRSQVREYLTHLGIPNADAAFEEWERTSQADETGYRYTKYAKTFVRTGNAGNLRVWSEPTGMVLELVPQSDPTSVVSGGTLDVLLLNRGNPLAGYPVSLLRDGIKDARTAVTDSEGRVRLTLPEAGETMLRATTLEPSADTASAWDVHFTTMTFEVKASTARGQ